MAVHSSFLNCTTENNERRPVGNKKKQTITSLLFAIVSINYLRLSLEDFGSRLVSESALPAKATTSTMISPSPVDLMIQSVKKFLIQL